MTNDLTIKELIYLHKLMTQQPDSDTPIYQERKERAIQRIVSEIKERLSND